MKIRFAHLGFTLVELVVGITISMLLMVSVGVFISGGMQNVFLQQKVFQNAGDFVSFNTTLHSRLNLLDSQATITPNSILFKSQKYFGNGGFTYIGTGASDSGFYCSGSELPADNVTQHLFIKDFIPYFENGETTLAQVFSGSVTNGADTYISYVKQHIVTNSAGNILVGRNTFGQQLGPTGTGTYLNAPTGLAFSGGILYIADTLNNRILAYNIGDSSIQVLLDETDGLDEPTGLTFSGSSLLIANSAAGEILEYSSNTYTSFPDLEMSFKSQQDDIASFDFEIYLSGTLVNPGITQTNFTNFNVSDNFFQIDNNHYGAYMFVNYNGSKFAWGGCNNGDKRYNGGNPQKCDPSGTGSNSSPSTEDINTIELKNIPGIPDNGTYYTRVELSSGYKQYFPYFTQGDGDLLTKDDNTLKIIASNIDYPSGLNIVAGVLDYETFSGATFSGYSFSGTYDSVLETPIESFEVDLGIGELLTMRGNYYKNYDCYNEDNRITREFIWKKNLK